MNIKDLIKENYQFLVDDFSFQMTICEARLWSIECTYIRDKIVVRASYDKRDLNFNVQIYTNKTTIDYGYCSLLTFLKYLHPEVIENDIFKRGCGKKPSIEEKIIEYAKLLRAYGPEIWNADSSLYIGVKEMIEEYRRRHF